ncbi:MAG: hypothetical protein K0R36_3374 [Chryseobacterium sp.]|jgi:hypothetical protein|nr:hypothetical protein [Chryseobacterium sp.]
MPTLVLSVLFLSSVEIQYFNFLKTVITNSETLPHYPPCRCTYIYNNLANCEVILLCEGH